MGETIGVLAGALSSALGGMSIGATRFLASAGVDSLTIGTFRFTAGFLLLLPAALLDRNPWPKRRDWPGVIGLGLLFFAVFPLLFNNALAVTTAARGALALSSVPVLTMLAAAALGIERLSLRKTSGVLIAMAGVVLALVTNIDGAPPGAWRGDLMMLAASFCLAFYNIWVGPFIARAGALSVTAIGMGLGAAMFLAWSTLSGSIHVVASFDWHHWTAAGWLGVVGGAFTFFLWAYALGKASPTRVAVSATLNPVTAGMFGAVLLAEPIGWPLMVGLVAVAAGIAIATSRARPAVDPL